MANLSDKSEKIKKYMQKYKDEYSKQYSCIVKSSSRILPYFGAMSPGF